ncbi:MAG: alkaline phosphatase D family protein [Chloroflexi bacterium]|nr:alkaline phosphatase D family protein [Chloroflexota bacterium]
MLTHGPFVSAVDDTSAAIFARVSASSSVQVVYSGRVGSHREIRVSPATRATPEDDFTVRISLTGLQPATTYRYKILIDRQPALAPPVGPGVQRLPVTLRFTTAPPMDTLSNFSFAVFSDLSQRPGFRALAYQSAASDSPAFVLQIGDFDHSNPAASEPVDIENWRIMNRSVIYDNAAGQDFAAFIAPSFPFFHVWDDHDYGMDNADRTAPWKDLATKAFKEYYPLPALPNPDGGLWYSFRYAQAEIFMLDLRSQRDPDDLPDGPDKSMLDGGGLPIGQKQWLESGLLASTARWKFIVSSSVWNPHSKQVDSWVLFQSEQQELVNFIQSNNITGVIIISGDLHSGGAIDNGTNSYFPDISVPTTNIRSQRSCTGGYCGAWSEGIVVGVDPSGYGLITVQYDAVSGVDTVILRAKGEDGSTRLVYSVSLPPAVRLHRR